MEPIEYLRALRRRWTVIAAATALAGGVAWATTTVVPVSAPSRTYVATVVLLNTAPLNDLGITKLSTLAQLIKLRPVAERVAEELDYDGDPMVLAAQVQAVANEEEGLFTVTATDSDAEEAERVADTFVDELIGFLTDRRAATMVRESKNIQQRLDELSKEIDQLDRRLVTSPSDNVLRAQRDAKVLTYQGLSQTYQSILSAASSSSSAAQSLDILQEATAEPVAASTFQPAVSRSARVALGAIIGLIVGVGIALLLERIDTRIRTREAAQESFGMPVLGEIPRLRTVGRPEGRIATAAQPNSPAADAFRLLAAGLTSPPAPNGGPGKLDRAGGGVQMIMVTSARRGEGKSTVVANLAGAFAQIGRSVLLVSCDLRHPTVHRTLGVENALGLADALRKRWDGQSHVLDGHVKETALPGVRLVPSGPTPPNSSTLLAAPKMRQALREARRLADVVLLDTPPILTASDAAHLVEEVDAVLLVARAGWTTAEQAERASQLLRQLEAPVAGLALNEMTELPISRGGWARLRQRLRSRSWRSRNGDTAERSDLLRTD